MNTYCLTLDLKNDPELIREYEDWHQQVWPEVLQSIKDAGIRNMKIYRFHTRLCMFMEVEDHFSFEDKARRDQENEIVQKWERLMWTYQSSIPGADTGVKWQLMDLIFETKQA
ncbi:MAG: L-rhamnose mutarotase [Bacteroidota bacterium]